MTTGLIYSTAVIHLVSSKAYSCIEIIHLVRTKIFRKNKISSPDVSACHGVRNISFSKNFAYVLHEWSYFSKKFRWFWKHELDIGFPKSSSFWSLILIQRKFCLCSVLKYLNYFKTTGRWSVNWSISFRFFIFLVWNPGFKSCMTG